MGRLAGHYEWDNDDLTPGRKKEGGLHQNLFDRDGNLRGNARFVPSDQSGAEPFMITETVYVPADQRRRTQEQQDFEQAIANLVVLVISRGVAKAVPVAKRWWQETAHPALADRRSKLRDRRHRRTPKDPVAREMVDDAPVGLLDRQDAARRTMSSAEAQARYLAALAARAFSDEQMRLVTGADIIGGGNVADLERCLAALPADQIKSLLTAMATNPALLGEANLAELASILSQHDLPSPNGDAELP